MGVWEGGGGCVIPFLPLEQQLQAPSEHCVHEVPLLPFPRSPIPRSLSQVQEPQVPARHPHGVPHVSRIRVRLCQGHAHVCAGPTGGVLDGPRDWGTVQARASLFGAKQHKKENIGGSGMGGSGIGAQLLTDSRVGHCFPRSPSGVYVCVVCFLHSGSSVRETLLKPENYAVIGGIPTGLLVTNQVSMCVLSATGLAAKDVGGSSDPVSALDASERCCFLVESTV